MINFDEVKIEEALWLAMKKNDLTHKINHLIEKIDYCYWNSIFSGKYNNKEIKSLGNNFYKIRLNKSYRMVFKVETENSRKILILSKILSHKEGEEVHEKGFNIDENLIQYAKIEDVFDEINNIEISGVEVYNNPSNYTDSPINRIWSPEDEKRLLNNVNADLKIALNQTQEKFINKDGPLLIRGAAGSGKTTIALYRLIKSSTKRRLYVTLTRSLKFFAEDLFKSLANDLNTNKPLFLTIDELCLMLIGSESHLLPQKRMTFEIFKNLSFIKKISHSKGIDPYILWEEIRIYLKINKLQNRQEYLSTNKESKIVEAVLSVYQKYVDYLEINQMWDDIDLAKFALSSINSDCFYDYEEVIVDEVQDLTELQLKVICLVCQTPFGLFLVGDEAQAIHPTKFNWESTKLIISKSFQERGYGQEVEMAYLYDNYRSPFPIFNLSNLINLWRNKLYKLPEPNQKFRCYKRYGESIDIISPKDVDSFSFSILPYTTMVIVPSESAKQEAIKKFGIGSVLSIFEAKGLENKEVILYKFFEDGDIKNVFQFLIKFVGISSKSSNILTFINIINVAVTRAENKLFLVSDIDNIRKFEPFSKIEFNISNSDSLKQFLQNGDKNYEGYFQWAKKLELAGALTQATENYLEAAKLGHSTASAFANKCKGLIAKENHNYLEALSFFEQAYDCNDISLLYEIYECEGILALQKEDINLAAPKFEQANISLGEIIQKILSSSSPEKYSFCLSLILKQDIESLKVFLSKTENIKAMKFSMEEVSGFSGSQEKTKIYGKSRLKYIELRLIDWKNTIEQIVIPIQKNNQSQSSLIHKKIEEEFSIKYQDRAYKIKNAEQQRGKYGQE